MHAEVYGLGFDYIEKYPQYIRAVTVDDISRAAKMYLDSENYTLVVVGPVAEDGNLIRTWGDRPMPAMEAAEGGVPNTAGRWARR